MSIAVAIPIRFEDEYPEEAETLMAICSNKELRESVQAHEHKMPKQERIFQFLDPIKATVNATLKTLFRGGDGSPITRAVPKVGRNDPCPCSSGKKYKKCCIIHE